MALEMGMSVSVTQTFTDADREEYTALSGQRDEADEKGYRIPGPLIGGLFSYLHGTELPGRGTNYLKQHLEFPEPAYYGEELVATVEITRLRPEKALVNLETTCRTSDGRVVCTGEALVLAHDTRHFG